jgi:sortase A
MKKLATVILIIGILVALSPLAGKLYLQWQENKLMDEWYNSVDASTAEASMTSDANPEDAYGQLQDAFSADARNNMEEVTSSITTNSSESSVQATAGAAVKSPAKSQTVLGIIKIDKIKIKYPVVEGVKPSNLSRAIGHIPGTAGLGQPGNCALAGHRNYTFGRYFNRLDEVKVGDIISITTKKAEFRYKVYEKLVVKPDDVSVVKGSKDDTVLTLITCTPIYVATHRLILHARLDEKILLEP